MSKRDIAKEICDVAEKNGYAVFTHRKELIEQPDIIGIDNFKRVIVINGAGEHEIVEREIPFYQPGFAEQITRDGQAILRQMVGRFDRLIDQAASTIIEQSNVTDHDRKKRSNLQTHKSPYENWKGKR